MPIGESRSQIKFKTVYLYKLRLEERGVGFSLPANLPNLVTRKSKSEPHDLEDETRHDAVPEGEESEQEEIHKHGCR